MKNKFFWAFIAISVLIRFYFIYLNVIKTDYLILPPSQDNYIIYVDRLYDGTLNTQGYGESRFFPWYPVSIYLLGNLFLMPSAYAGLTINILALIGAIYLFWYLTKDKLATLIFAFFPPIWFIAPVKIATEPLNVFFLLLSLFFLFRKKFLWAGLILGISTGVRLISVCLLLALIFVFYKEFKNKLLPIIYGYLAGILPLIAYNLILFKNAFQQFAVYPKVGGASGSSFTFFQIFIDIQRALSWHQYKILVSGILYILITVLAIYLLYLFREKIIYRICFFWSLISFLFIFSYGPNPILEEYRRFIIPFLPALILGLTAPMKTYKIFLNRIIKYVKKN